MSLVLLLIIAVKYALAKLSVTQELDIGRSLYPEGRVPNDLKLEDRFKITSQVVIFMVLYILLGLFVDYIIVVSAIMTGVACVDWMTRYVINKGIKRTFADPEYAPLSTERNYKTILDRRAIAEWYLFRLPHLWKETGCIAGSGLACGIAVYGYFNNANLSVWAYSILIGTQVVNEIITMSWRVNRDRRFKAIDDRTALASAL